MKAFLKKILPAWAVEKIRDVKGRINEANAPVATRYLGSNASVVQCYVSYNQYGGYCVPQSSHHRPAAQAILKGSVWEPETIEFLMEHANGGDIVHAGTYFGDFIPALSRACKGDTLLWAFEPNPENYQCALATIAINGLTNVKIQNAGLGSSMGELPMAVADQNGRGMGGASRIVDAANASPNGFVTVPILALDASLPVERQVSIIQLDVEGFEKPALTGAMETIRRCMPILILENLPEEEWVSENILALGYRFSGKLHENTVLLPPAK